MPRLVQRTGVLTCALLVAACSSTSGAGGATGAASAAGLDKPGFYTKVHDGRLLVARAGSKAAQELAAANELRVSVTRIGAGPNGMTVIAPDGETIDAYLRASR
jgi:hypothetical protein